MKILFDALHFGYYRNLESVVEALAGRGHRIRLQAERAPGSGEEAIVDRLAKRYPNVTCGGAQSREEDSLFLATKIRLGHDYLRYLDPVYNGSSGLAPRARERTPTGIVWLADRRALRRPAARRAVRRALDAIDRAVPPSPAIERFLDEQQPDLVVITPLIGLVPSSQVDLLRSAIRRCIPTAVFVWSWDHLSSKAVIRDMPDALFVWNETQRREAVEMHAVPAKRVVVTGAQCFDQWFDRSPSRSREEFVRRAGLPDTRPYLLWACSALLPGSPPEPDVFMRWAAKLRGAPDPAVRNAAILIRPHPARLPDWDAVDWRQFGPIALFGDMPIDDQTRADYFDSLHFSAAVVGITTSAFVEAAIAGRPVLSFYEEDLRQEHEGSLHFQHLLRVAGGVMMMGRTLDEHVGHLGSVISGTPADVADRLRQFVQEFVRPRGLKVRATDIAVDALERLGSTRPAVAAGRLPLAGRVGLQLLKALARHPRLQLLLLNRGEVEAALRQEEKERMKQSALEDKRRRRADKARAAADRQRALALKRKQKDRERARA